MRAHGCLVTTNKGDVFMKPKVHELATARVRRDSQLGQISEITREVVPIIMSGMIITALVISMGCAAGRSGRCGCKSRVRTAKHYAVHNDCVDHGCVDTDDCVGDGCTDSDDYVAPSKTPEPSKDSTGHIGGHGENYEWLIGQLQRVHVPREGWKIRYLPLDQKDQWGGSVVLAPDIRIEEFTEGDTVYVEGKILSNRASLYLSGPRYRLSKIRMFTDEDQTLISF